jgi:hypothetical protein
LAKNEVVVKDHGWNDFFKRIKEMKDAKIRVGVLGDAKGGEREPGSGLTVAEIAVVNEFGTEDGHIPARSFLRSTFDAQREHLADLGKELMGKVLDGHMTIDRALGVMGASLASSIRDKIRSNIQPVNAPSTIMHKVRQGRTARLFKRAPKGLGGALAQVGAAAAVKTLIDTGRMLAAVSWARITGAGGEGGEE